ncbi:hypothetical protein [Streptomyces sp. WAC 04229]|uniref:ATP-dependent DNA ligase n=1 Tax=Streptomyces sp. WAC 04229 TaxID=2203206 RepID=UPI003D74AEE8
MTWALPEPMLTSRVGGPGLPSGAAAEPKWDGHRAQLARYPGGRVLLRSRQGTDMTATFPEVREAALAQLPGDTGLDGELVVGESGALAFERLQQRLARRRGDGALAAARTWSCSTSYTCVPATSQRGRTAGAGPPWRICSRRRPWPRRSRCARARQPRPALCCSGGTTARAHCAIPAAPHPSPEP